MKNPRRFWNSEVAEVPLGLQRERKRERAKARSSDWDPITIPRSISRFWDEASCDWDRFVRKWCRDSVMKRFVRKRFWDQFVRKKRHDSSHLWGRSDYEIKRFVWKWFWDAICVEVIMRLSDLCGSDFDFVWKWFWFCVE
jgi:hypothetical protein